jgi:hypothetical protein
MHSGEAMAGEGADEIEEEVGDGNIESSGVACKVT